MKYLLLSLFLGACTADPNDCDRLGHDYRSSTSCRDVRCGSERQSRGYDGICVREVDKYLSKCTTTYVCDRCGGTKAPECSGCCGCSC